MGIIRKAAASVLFRKEQSEIHAGVVARMEAIRGIVPSVEQLDAEDQAIFDDYLAGLNESSK